MASESVQSRADTSDLGSFGADWMLTQVHADPCLNSEKYSCEYLQNEYSGCAYFSGLLYGFEIRGYSDEYPGTKYSACEYFFLLVLSVRELIAQYS